MKKFFKVAGCCFAVAFDDRHPYGDHLYNYAPFETDEADTLFTLSFDDGLQAPDRQPLIVGEAAPEEPKIDIYKCEAGLWAESAPYGNMPSVASLLIPSEGEDAVLNLFEKRYEKFAIDNALMLLFALKTYDRDVLEMHSSVISYKGKGYMFLGESGTGKSTHSRMWLETFPEAELLNDDNPIVRIVDGKPFVYGSPWSGKTPCYNNKEVPVGAIVQIRQAPFNKISELLLPEAYAYVYSSTSGFKADQRMADALHGTIVSLITQAKCCILDCLPDKGAAIECNNNVTK